jgi:putative membrane protein
MMMGGDFGWGSGWMFFGGLMMLLFWGGIIALIVLAVRALSGSSSNMANRSNATPIQRNGAAQSPLEILQARYAKGEISREEYTDIQRDLQAT